MTYSLVGSNELADMHLNSPCISLLQLASTWITYCIALHLLASRIASGCISFRRPYSAWLQLWPFPKIMLLQCMTLQLSGIFLKCAAICENISNDHIHCAISMAMRLHMRLLLDITCYSSFTWVYARIWWWNFLWWWFILESNHHESTNRWWNWWWMKWLRSLTPETTRNAGLAPGEAWGWGTLHFPHLFLCLCTTIWSYHKYI